MTLDLKSRKQFWIFVIIGILLLMSVWLYAANPVYIYIVSYLWFGFIYGNLQQYGRFCFASAWRDFVMFNVTRMFVGLMIGFMTMAVVSAAIHTFAPAYYPYHPTPFGLHEFIGGILFGLGMVLAGGCATGSLYKSGEGSLTAFTVVLALSFSQAIFLVTYYDNVWNSNKVVNLPIIGDYKLGSKFHPGWTVSEGNERLEPFFAKFGAAKYFMGDMLVSGIIIPLILLTLVYIYTTKTSVGSKKLSRAGFWEMIVASKRTSIAAVLLGIVSAGQLFVQKGLSNRLEYLGEKGFTNFGQVLTKFGFASEVSSTGKVFDPQTWYITSQEAQAAAWFIEKIGINMKDNIFFGVQFGIPEPWHNAPLFLSIGLMMGAATMALKAGEFKWKVPDRGLFLSALIGGTLMGIASRTAIGCNIGAFFTRASFGNLGGWLFFMGMGIGAFIAGRSLMWWSARQLASVEL